ncbi:MAG: hypothetical protein ABI718_18625, partial [Acidobacteriota bacterium]
RLERENRQLRMEVEFLKNNRGAATILLQQKLLVHVFCLSTGGSGRLLFGGSTPKKNVAHGLSRT